MWRFFCPSGFAVRWEGLQANTKDLHHTLVQTLGNPSEAL